MTDSQPELKIRIPQNTLISIYRIEQKIRMFEERVSELLLKKEIRCPTHLYIGQEAIATGVCANLTTRDCIFSNHRNHGHFIAKGGDIKKLMSEMYGKATGCSNGMGGSMHLSEPEIGFLGSPAIVGGSIPLAVGVALSFSIKKQSNVAISFFGEGAVNEGVWHESLNFASLKKLPVIFICENNLYATHMPVKDMLANPDISDKANAFNIPGVRVDGNNIFEVFHVTKDAIKKARQGEGPTLIECMTYRWRGHVGPNDDIDKGLRSQQELDHWIDRDPIHALERFMLKEKLLSTNDIIRIKDNIEQEIEESIIFAKESPFPKLSRLHKGVFKA